MFLTGFVIFGVGSFEISDKNCLKNEVKYSGPKNYIDFKLNTHKQLNYS